MKKLIYVLAAAATGCAAAQADDVQPPDFSKLYGSYQFGDGECMTGGRMDEGGERFLLFLDVWDGDPGGLFHQTTEGLQSVIPNGPEIAFTGTVDDPALIWASGGETRTGDRISAPLSRAAAFSSGYIEISGELFIPAAPTGKMPAIILAHGSGEVSRYMGVWITYFTDLGFAVLSYDKRGVGESQGDWRGASFDDLSADLVAAADWLAAQPEIDSGKIGLITSSQSGWYGPRTAQQSDHFSFLIQRVGPGVSIAPTTLHEITVEWRADGLSEEMIAAAGAFWTRLHEAIETNKAIVEGQAMLDEARQADWFEPAYGDWSEITADWWARKKINLTYEPAKTAAAIEIPVLWFLAEKDENVPYEASKNAIEEAVAETGKEDLTLVTVAGAAHSFLIRQPDGGYRYTTQYWSPMALWLRGQGFLGEPSRAVAGCKDFPF